MFIKLNVSQEKEPVSVNTEHIALMKGNEIFLSNGIQLNLVGNSRAELENNLFGDINEAAPKASEHTSYLLNELHKLCGGRGEAKPTSDRKARLKSRLKDFTEEELKTAAENLGANEFMQGANENGKRYGTIDYLLRTSANINKCLEDAPQKKKKMF